MSIQTVVVGGPVASILILKALGAEGQPAVKLPIRIGHLEATAITLGCQPREGGRPITHDLLGSTIEALGARVEAIDINDVSGTTFFATIELVDALGDHHYVDARPSDALALAVRCDADIYADDRVLDVAGLPDFQSVEKDERAREEADFHAFVENLSPDDFR